MGIIGCGRVTTLFHLKAIEEVNDVKVVAVADKDSERMEDVRKRTSASSGYLDYTDLLSDSKVDVVTVNTPPSLHLEMTLDALESGKHVQCEKPISLTADECESLIDEQELRGLIVLPVHNYAFSPSLLKMEELLDEIGDVERVRIDFLNNLKGYRSQTDFRTDKMDGIVDDVFPHLLSVSLPLAGIPSRLEKVEWWCEKYDVCDNMRTLLRTDEGVECDYNLNWTSLIPRFKVLVEGSLGDLKTELMLSPYKTTLSRGGKTKTFQDRGLGWLFDLIRFKHPGFENQYRHLVSLVEGEIDRPRFTLREEMAMIQIMERVSEYFEV
ncbi:MAG: Gfo/Idh/MocA family protein [Candidatus Bathyarchaeia archaeon]